jgi:selenide, water dikinase
MVRGLTGSEPAGEPFGELVVGLDTGDDAAVHNSLIAPVP